MNPTKKKVTKNVRNSPKVPADFDSESEDQNGLHVFQNSASIRIPPSLSSTCKLPKRKDHCGLWELETPSGTDSGICSSDRTIPWSPEQHPSKSKSTLIVAPVIGQKTHFVPSSISKMIPPSLNSPLFFHIFSFVASCIILLVLYCYVFVTMAQFRNSLSSLSEEIQNYPVCDSCIYSNEVKSSIQQVPFSIFWTSLSGHDWNVVFHYLCNILCCIK